MCHGIISTCTRYTQDRRAHKRAKEDLFFFVPQGDVGLFSQITQHFQLADLVVLESADILSRDGLCCQLRFFFFCAFAMYEVPENLRADCADVAVAKNTWVGWTWPGGVGERGRSATQKGSDRFDNTEQNFQSRYESFKRRGDEVLPEAGFSRNSQRRTGFNQAAAIRADKCGEKAVGQPHPAEINRRGQTFHGKHLTTRVGITSG